MSNFSSRTTKRPLNKCKDCGRTWHPRGSNLSARCPNCGSRSTKIAGLGIFGTIAMGLFFLASSGHNGSNDAAATSPTIPATAVAASAPDFASVNAPGALTAPAPLDQPTARSVAAASTSEATTVALAEPAQPTEALKLTLPESEPPVTAEHAQSAAGPDTVFAHH